MNFGEGSAKAWTDIWGAGQGVGLMNDVPTVAALVQRLKQEYDSSLQRLSAQ
jgi:nitronate monooxygenase